MPIMAVQDQTDARGAARVLATTVRKCIDQELQPERHMVALNGLYRLLKGYRTHRFTGYEYQPRSQRGPEALTLMPPPDRHVVDLRAALHLALSKAYQGESEERAMDAIEGVIRSMASAGAGAAPEPERRRASRFLANLVEHLSTR